MADEERKRLPSPLDDIPTVYFELERQLVNIIGEDAHDAARNFLGDLGRMGRESYQFAVDLVTELATELTGVKAVKVTPKNALEFDCDISRKSELKLKLKHTIAPLVELQSINFAKNLNFGAVVDKEKKGLRMNIRDGLSLTFNIPIIGEQTIEVKGSGLLTRNDRNQLILSTTVMIPGFDSPVTIALPLTQAFLERKKKV